MAKTFDAGGGAGVKDHKGLHGAEQAQHLVRLNRDPPGQTVGSRVDCLRHIAPSRERAVKAVRARERTRDGRQRTGPSAAKVPDRQWPVHLTVGQDARERDGVAVVVQPLPDRPENRPRRESSKMLSERRYAADAVLRVGNDAAVTMANLVARARREQVLLLQGGHDGPGARRLARRLRYAADPVSSGHESDGRPGIRDADRIVRVRRQVPCNEGCALLVVLDDDVVRQRQVALEQAREQRTESQRTRARRDASPLSNQLPGELVGLGQHPRRGRRRDTGPRRRKNVADRPVVRPCRARRMHGRDGRRRHQGRSPVQWPSSMARHGNGF